MLILGGGGRCDSSAAMSFIDVEIVKDATLSSLRRSFSLAIGAKRIVPDAYLVDVGPRLQKFNP